MTRTLIFAMAIGLLSCTSREDKMLADLKQVDTHISDKGIELKNIPDSFSTRLHDFAVAFPTHPKSENYLYTATLLAEQNGRIFETAKWCEEYVKLFPKGKFVKDALVSAAHHFEKSGTYDKAIWCYEKIYTDFPKADEADDARLTAKYLKMGLLTPEAQFEYTQKQRDSSAKK
jgi:TolA-binding protein